MGKAIRASALVLLLVCSAQAGIMQNGSPAPPPSQPANSVQEPATGGEISTGETPVEVMDVLTQVGLELLALSQTLY